MLKKEWGNPGVSFQILTLMKLTMRGQKPSCLDHSFLTPRPMTGLIN